VICDLVNAFAISQSSRANTSRIQEKTRENALRVALEWDCSG